MASAITFSWWTTDYYPDNEFRPVLCLSYNGKMMTFKSIRNYGDWQWKVDKYSIALWIFQDEIIPDDLILNKEED